jgi:mannose-6-phosphate isomerase-like protein (cupin superfamily)
MKAKRLRFAKGFRVIPGNRRSQAAEMVLEPGDAEGDPENRHRGADQWLYVVSGTGSAKVNGRRYALREGTLVLIEHGDRHEIRNTGRTLLLRTLNFYVPPGYSKDGEPLPRGRK